MIYDEIPLRAFAPLPRGTKLLIVQPSTVHPVNHGTVGEIVTLDEPYDGGPEVSVLLANGRGNVIYARRVTLAPSAFVDLLAAAFTGAQ